MKWLTDIAGSLIPSDDTSPQVIRAYRLRVALVACSAWLAVFVLLIPAMIVGVPMLGRVAWSDEVTDKIAQSVAPIQRELADLRREIRASTAATNAALAESIYQEILQLSRQRCGATAPSERDRLYGLIRARALRYQGLSGDMTYAPPTCADL